ncbi:MAG TPA: hypothetical protein VKU82_02260 [Planctomycetaceae bacterium]|nr:hypothetical protein [Planctomycetaceae bacterium]
MTRRTANFGLPLLAKELLEQAARKRTYVVRVVYAVLLFAAAYLLFYEILRVGASSPFAALGRGRKMFEMLVMLQFVGIYVFTPAITCGVLTQEKEKASLQLLFLTRLGPWAILFEKLASRLVPMFGFLLLSLPLLAYAYTLGGISREYFISGLWMLVVSVLETAALALMCSAYFRTTVGAFVASYLLELLLLFGPSVAWTVASAFSYEGSNLVQSVAWRRGWWFWNSVQIPDEMMLQYPFFGALLFIRNHFGVVTPAGALLLQHVLHSVPIVLAGISFLVIARLCIVRRAFAPPRNRLLSFFKSLDRLFNRFNENRLTQGIVLIRDAAPLPDDEPIAWRETSKRSLGRARYLVRLFVAVEAPLAVLCVLMTATGGGPEALSFLTFTLWGVAVLIVSVQSASLIAGERSHQTVDVLCATPLSGREIIEQKFRGVQRVMLVLLVPFFTNLCFDGWWQAQFSHFTSNWYSRHSFNFPLYVICTILSVGIYLPMVAWLSLWIGLKVRTQARAIISSLAAIVGWCTVPLMVFVMPLGILFPASQVSIDFAKYLVLLSLASIIAVNEFDALPEFPGSGWLALLVNFMVYGTALMIFRRLCLTKADRLLGRLEADRERSTFVPYSMAHDPLAKPSARSTA